MKPRSVFALIVFVAALAGCAGSGSRESSKTTAGGLLHDAVLSGPESETRLYRESEPTEFGTRSTIKYRAMEF